MFLPLQILLEHYHPGEDSEEEKLPVIDEVSHDLTRDLSSLTGVTSDTKNGHSGLTGITRGLSALTISDNQKSRKQSGTTFFDGWRTRKSVASSYRTYQVNNLLQIVSESEQQCVLKKLTHCAFSRSYQ